GKVESCNAQRACSATHGQGPDRRWSVDRGSACAGRTTIFCNYSPPGHQVGVSPSPFGRGWRGAPGEGENAEMSRHARPHPGPPGVLLPKGEGHARGFSLVNVLNSYDLLQRRNRFSSSPSFRVRASPVTDL